MNIAKILECVSLVGIALTPVVYAAEVYAEKIREAKISV